MKDLKNSPGGFNWNVMRMIFSLILFFPSNLSIKGFYQKHLMARADTAKMIVLETVNSFRGHWYGTNEGYLYGTNYGNIRQVVRKTELGQRLEVRGTITSLDTSYTEIAKIFPATTPGLLFIMVQDRLNNFYLLKSTDGALTFKKVFTFGEGNGINQSNSTNVRLLRGILELTRDLPSGGGKGDIYFGEYNVNRNRIRGSTNDRLRILKSTDNGDTWVKVMEWNTNGTNQVGHIHAMKQDPYTGDIYICTGDDLNKAGIIKWDGVSPWSDNTTLTGLSTMKGFSVLTGGQRYRAVDMLFDQNSFYTVTDTQKPNNLDGSESGIWKGSKDLSTYKRVNNHIYDYDPMHIGWFGEKIGNTFIFTTSREIEGKYKWKKLNLEVYTSNDGENWYASGQLNMRDLSPDTTTKYITSVFVLNNKLYIDCVGGAGHYSTIQCELSRIWKASDDPVILHPVFFVGKWNSPGNDANSGTNPDAPKATLKNILEGSRISAGARVRISSGTFPEGFIYPDWSSAFIQGSGSVLIEGKGIDSTYLIRSPGPGEASGMKIERLKTLSGMNSPLIFKDLSYSNPLDGGTLQNSYIIENVDSYLKAKGCRFGGEQNDDSPLIYLSGAGAGYVSDSTWHISPSLQSTGKSSVVSNAVNQTIHIQNSIFWNAYDGVAINFTGANLNLKNCTFYGIMSHGVAMNAVSTLQPVILNNIFSGTEAPIYDLSGINETNIDFNYYERPNVNVNGGANSISSSGRPVFVDPEKGNFELLSNSPVIMRGKYLPEVPYDIRGRIRAILPSMGAYESPALIVTPSRLMFDAQAGSAGRIIVWSNSVWNISGGADWINIQKTSGSGRDTIAVSSLTSNSTTDKRSCNVIFSGLGLIADTVLIIQNALNATDSPIVETGIMKIYPNPVSDFLRIDYGSEVYNKLSVINSLGIVLIKKEVILPVQQVDFTNLVNGIYFMRFTGPGVKVIKVQVIHH